ncbi:UDP-glucose 4-epimerase GalE [Falsibacillus albus]|uniref:UDP-glucose 4-epimerase n=1 Tax=Falsibacillus albus TaxID=2478915 RepID=A0A3L7K1K8_9BACI|nr:UDP-glucose 4-epimerase GalE [Falsibacillus albus]RLQ96279.1 UDP-glucose 4-epimerase GalE [Falsibacillus albus]
MAVLVTGGAGYIGTHTVVELLNEGIEVVVVDDFSNSKPDALERAAQIAGRRFPCYEASLLDKESLQAIFSNHPIEAVIHLAGYKAVGESVKQPLAYYHNNISGTILLLQAMAEFNVKNIVFSSSATVYGFPENLPLTEEAPLQPTNTYGRTKLFNEIILNDLLYSDPSWSITILRYFNPIGSHDSGRIGEDPNGIPNNLMPYITKVAAGLLPHVRVFGCDYETVDGTGIRDYIHVMDLARGHVKALKKNLQTFGLKTYNLGTGIGKSVLQVIQTFENATGIPIPYQLESRRTGDIASCFADASKAEIELEWKAVKSFEEMCLDAWNWQHSQTHRGKKDNRSVNPRLQQSEDLLVEVK